MDQKGCTCGKGCESRSQCISETNRQGAIYYLSKGIESLASRQPEAARNYFKLGAACAAVVDHRKPKPQ
jgi:hypothetical protein